MPDDPSASGVAPAPEDPTQAASSAEPVPGQEQVSQEGTAPSTPPDPAPAFHMPPAERWEELRQQRVAAEQRAAQAEQLAQLAIQKLQTVTPQPPVQDFWAGKIDHPDPATARYYQEQKAMVDPLLQEVRALRAAVDAGSQELAGVKVENFRLRYPDVAKNSEDEKAISEYVKQGYPMEAARKLARHDRLEQELQTLKAKQSSVGSKVAANQTGPTTGIPATSGLPGRPGNWRENVQQAFRKGGSLADILNAAGASRAT